MRNIFWQFIAFSASGMLLTQPVAARQLSPAQALTRVQKTELRTEGMRKIRAAAQPKLVKTALTERRQLPAFYVFESDGRLLIASADDRLPAILGYSESTEIPENMEWWLSQYEQEIGAYYDTADETPSFVSTYDQYASWAPLETLCKTEWNQTSPFNDQCPMLNGSRTVTGCVATALAQLIRYKGYMNCKGTNSYTWGAGNKTLSFNYDNYKVDFSLLRDAYKGDATQEQRNEVAKLMYACAIAVNSNFNAATGANFHDNNIRNYLGYGDSFTLNRDGFTTQEWEKVCYDLIKAGHPLGYVGSGTGGHAFVCDGYSENGFFHFNWGWGGLSNGYFRLSALNPRDQGTGSFEGGYTMGQAITVLIGDNDEKVDISAYRPGTIIWDPSMPLNISGVTTNKKENTCTLNLGIRSALFKSNTNTQSVKFGLILHNRNGQEQSIILPATAFTSMTVQQGVSNGFSVKFDRDLLTPGAEYDAYPVYTFKGYDAYWRHQTYGNPAAFDHWLISVDDKHNVTCGPIEAVNLGLNAYDMETNDLYIGEKDNSFKCLLANSSPEDINEIISLRLYRRVVVLDKDEEVIKYEEVKNIATSYMLLSAGETMALEASFALSDVKDPGEYYFCLYNNTRNKLLGEPSILRVDIKAGKRPEDQTKQPSLANNYQVALWADGKMAQMSPQTILSGDELKLSTSIITATSQEVNYSLAIFNHGETYPAIAKYPAEKIAVKGDGTWHQAASFEIKPELPLGIYSMAFVDQYDGLVSYPVDLFIDAEIRGIRYSFDPKLEGLTVSGHNGALSGAIEIPAEVLEVPVKAIADGVFDQNRSISAVALPASLESIGLNAFRSASALKSVWFESKDVPFANVVIPFGCVGLNTEFYVDSEAYSAFEPSFLYRGHALLYAAISEVKLPAESVVETDKELDLNLEVTPAEHTNPNFTVEVADPDILSAEMVDGKLHIAPKAVGETEVTLTSHQPFAPKATVKVSVKEPVVSLTDINAENGADAAFDILGRRVNPSAPGIIIKNGKKIIKK